MFRVLIALGCFALAAAPAHAASFSFISNDGLTRPFTFSTSTTPSPDLSDASGFTLQGVSTTEAGTFGPLVYDADYTFYNDDAFGGFENGFVAYYSRQLFGGTTLAPVFYNGSFELSDFAGGPTVATLTISDGAIASVPEPTTWAMTIFGFGLIGGVMRRRRRNVATAVRFA